MKAVDKLIKMKAVDNEESDFFQKERMTNKVQGNNDGEIAAANFAEHRRQPKVTWMVSPVQHEACASDLASFVAVMSCWF
jgi:hypothetical protein